MKLLEMYVKASSFKTLREEAEKELKEYKPEELETEAMHKIKEEGNSKPKFTQTDEPEDSAKGKKYKNTETGEEVWEEDLPEDADVDEYGTEKEPFEKIQPKIKEILYQKNKELETKYQTLRGNLHKYFSEKLADEGFIDDLALSIGDTACEVNVLKKIYNDKKIYDSGLVTAQMLKVRFGVE